MPDTTGATRKGHALVAAIILISTAVPALAAQKLGEVQGARAPDAIYAKTCGYCHGRNVGPIILGRAIPAETVKYIVRHGQNGMPAFRPTEVTPAELDALATWVEKSAGRKQEHGQ